MTLSILLEAIIIALKPLYVRIDRSLATLGGKQCMLVEALAIVLASIHLILRAVESINLSGFRLHIVIRHQGPHQMMYEALNAEYVTANPVISVASPLTSESEVIVVADDIFEEYLALADSFLCGLAVDDNVLYFIEQAIDFPRLKLAVRFRGP